MRRMTERFRDSSRSEQARARRKEERTMGFYVANGFGDHIDAPCVDQMRRLERRWPRVHGSRRR
jgi:hypothetical protein